MPEVLNGENLVRNVKFDTKTPDGVEVNCTAEIHFASVEEGLTAGEKYVVWSLQNKVRTGKLSPNAHIICDGKGKVAASPEQAALDAIRAVKADKTGKAAAALLAQLQALMNEASE
jgi:hypothetical protein